MFHFIFVIYRMFNKNKMIHSVANVETNAPCLLTCVILKQVAAEEKEKEEEKSNESCTRFAADPTETNFSAAGDDRRRRRRRGRLEFVEGGGPSEKGEKEGERERESIRDRRGGGAAADKIREVAARDAVHRRGRRCRCHSED